MTTLPPAIETIGLGRDYGSTRALEALDLVVSTGSIVGLLGPNGAGKTTTLLLLATLLKPSRGRARIFDLDIARRRADIRRRLGLVFQEISLDGLLTVGENLLFAARLTGLHGSVAHRAVADGLARTGLTSRSSQPARQLSHGWRRLTDLARATLHRPDLLILDEPTVGLDPEHRDRIWKLLEAECREHGTTVLFSTHYLQEAETCDRVVLLAHGRVVASGTPAALKASIGENVLEIDGPDALRLVKSLHEVANVRVTIETERGYRVGISGSREGFTRLVATNPGVVRFALRPATLDDVYFALTQVASVPGPAVEKPA